MPAREFGLALQACCNATPRQTLAQCMFPVFNPAVVATPILSAQHLEQHLHAIETGHAWPFGRNDLKSFVAVVLGCLKTPPRPSVEYTFKEAAAIYYVELGP